MLKTFRLNCKKWSISGEVKPTTLDAPTMMQEARQVAAIHPNTVVKLPMTVEGLKATKMCTAEGIKINVTLNFHLQPGSLCRCDLTYLLS